MPTNNEFINLVCLAKYWRTDYFLNDWMLSEPRYNHFLFNFLVGPFTLLFPLETVGWVGRVVCWILILIALFRLGRQYALPFWMISLSLFLWMIYGPSLVAAEFILGGFEAKELSYVLLLFAVKGFVDKKRYLLSSALLGLSFSFHSAVGLWGGLALLPSLLALNYPINTVTKIFACTALFALPGVVLLFPTVVFRGTPDFSEEWKLLVLSTFPQRPRSTNLS